MKIIHNETFYIMYEVSVYYSFTREILIVDQQICFTFHNSVLVQCIPFYLNIIIA